MQTLHESRELRAAIKQEKQRGKTIALVPTMGNLHDGHLELVKRAHQLADVVIASIFVNPMQFGANEDLDSYPRTPLEDTQALQSLGTQYLFTPTVATMYPAGITDHTRVSIEALGADLCGQTRPNFFEGICTVVSKLFNLVQPNIAVFGEKDYQQLTIIRRMTADLCMPIDIIGVPTIREPNGLAMSSRNNYLSDGERNTASLIYQQLCAIKDQLLAGELDYKTLTDQTTELLSQAGFEPHYVEIRDGDTLASLETGVKPKNIVILIAANLGKTRLIDNMSFTL